MIKGSLVVGISVLVACAFSFFGTANMQSEPEIMNGVMLGGTDLANCRHGWQLQRGDVLAHRRSPRIIVVVRPHFS